MRPVVVAGHICLDLTPALSSPPAVEPGRLVAVGPLSITPGGCVSNTGLGLAALGVPVELIADAGSDALGNVLVELLAASGADVSGIARLQDQLTSYSVVVDFPGRDRTFWHHVGANAAFEGGGVVERLGAAARAGQQPILHLGYVTHLPALYAGGGAGLVRLVEAAHAAGAVVSLDMAEIGAGSEAGSVDWAALLGRTLPEVDAIKASTDDLAAMMTPRAGLDAAEWAELLVELGAAVALVTAGPDGLELRTASESRLRGAAGPLGAAPVAWANRRIHVPPLATEVLATTGAGDAAAAGFLAALAHGLGPEEAAHLSAAAAAARISGRPLADARRLASTFRPEW